MPALPISALHFAGQDWLLPAAALFAVGVLLVALGYRRAPSGGKRRWVRPACAALRLAALLLLALALLDPQWVTEKAKPGENIVALIADDSLSLGIRDAGEARSRGAALADALAEAEAAPDSWLVALGDQFEVRRYLLGARLRPVGGFGDLAFDGRATALGAGLAGLRERFAGRPLAAAILLTDGNATDAVDESLLGDLPPIFPIAVGSDEAAPDLGIAEASATETGFEDAPVTVNAQVLAAGFGGGPVPADAILLTEGGAEVSRQRLTLADGQPQAVRFEIAPEKPGLSFYTLRLAHAEPGTVDAAPQNDARVIAVRRGAGPYRLLYVGGRPNWEFKFLRRALAEDDQLGLVGLIRMADREPKFEWLGRKGERSNPLFRGFGQDPDDGDGFDKPVLVRLGVSGETELRDGFPKTEEELFGYHALILDAVEAPFFTVDQMEMIDRFVARRGGGFLMLGGGGAFWEGGYARTPIEPILPIYLQKLDRPTGEIRLDLTREGMLQPWARLRDTEAAERERLAAMPPFEVANAARAVKPGAAILATASGDGGARQPALAAHRYGDGRAAALLIGDLWRWGFQDPEQRPDFEKAWRQLARWLVADVPDRVSVEVAPAEGGAPGAIAIRATVRDEKYAPDPGARVALQITASTGESIAMEAEPVPGEPGVFASAYLPPGGEIGWYRVAVAASDAGGNALGEATSGWASNPGADEFRHLTPNRALLDLIAEKTGGRAGTLGDLAAIAEDLPDLEVPIKEARAVSLWHLPYVFLAALACLLGEWAIRRRFGGR